MLLLEPVSTVARIPRGALNVAALALPQLQGRPDRGLCVKDAVGCGGVAVKDVLLAKYMTGALLDALESPRVEQALCQGQDQCVPRGVAGPGPGAAQEGQDKDRGTVTVSACLCLMPPCSLHRCCCRSVTGARGCRAGLQRASR